MIRRAQHVGIVLHHQNRVSQVAQLFQDADQPRRVPRVQPDRRLIQHIQRAHQLRPQRSRQLNPLRLAARQRRSQPVQRQILEAHRIQKLQPLPHLVENRPGNLLLHRRQLQLAKKLLRLRNRQRRSLADIQPIQPHRTRLGAQPLSAALRALRVTAILAQHHAHMQLVLLPLHLRKESVHALKRCPLPRSTVSRAASGRSRHGTSIGTPSSAACFFRSVNHDRYFGRFHGSIAPSFRVRLLSGITRFRS